LIIIDHIFDQRAVVTNRHSVDAFWWGDTRLNDADKSAGLFKLKEGDLYGPCGFNLETAKRWADVVRKHQHIFAMLDGEVIPNWTLDDVRHALDVLQPMLPEVAIIPTDNLGSDTHPQWFDRKVEIDALKRNRDLVERVGIAWTTGYLCQRENKQPEDAYGRDGCIEGVGNSLSCRREVFGLTPQLVWCSTDYVQPEWAVREGIPPGEWGSLPRERVHERDAALLVNKMREYDTDYLAMWGRRANAHVYVEAVA
jgi:hypothetical protein